MIVQALPKKEIDKVEKHVFRVYDTNGDGYIDFIEFMVLFHILSGKDLGFITVVYFIIFSVRRNTPRRAWQDLPGV